MREASAIALKTFRGEVRSWIKGHDSPVSDADIAVDNFLREKLSRPGIGWLSEESADDLTRLDNERIFIVDPIDGTRSYLAGREDWSICAALIERGRPVAAAVYAPVFDEMYVASAGGGATRNDARDPGDRRRVLEGARIAGPQHHLERIAKIGSRYRSHTRKFTRWPCAWPASPAAKSTPPSPPSMRGTGTLRQRTFWCTKPGAR